jgi:hypothetical protein
VDALRALNPAPKSPWRSFLLPDEKADDGWGDDEYSVVPEIYPEILCKMFANIEANRDKQG